MLSHTVKSFRNYETAGSAENWRGSVFFFNDKKFCQANEHARIIIQLSSFLKVHHKGLQKENECACWQLFWEQLAFVCFIYRWDYKDIHIITLILTDLSLGFFSSSTHIPLYYFEKVHGLLLTHSYKLTLVSILSFFIWHYIT